MSTAPSLTQLHVPPLYTGDRMTQAEFHSHDFAPPASWHPMQTACTAHGFSPASGLTVQPC